MERTSPIAALEEEIAILKGEIKSILQEVRTSLLARENPFAWGAVDAPTAAPPLPPPAAPKPDVSPPSEAAAPAVASSRRENGGPDTEETHPAIASLPDTRRQASRREHVQEPAVPHERDWSVQTLANLMAWTHEAAERFSAQDLGIILSLARYGGLIEADLEGTLLKLARHYEPGSGERRANVNDFLLALRQLDAVLGGDQVAGAGRPARQAS